MGVSSLACVRDEVGGFVFLGGFDTKRCERKETRGGFRSTEFVSVCKFSRKDPSWGGFFPMDGSEWSAETSSSVRGAETLSDILELVIIESARGWEGIQSSQRSRDAVRADKSAVRGNTSGFAIDAGEVLCSLLFAASFSGNNV